MPSLLNLHPFIGGIPVGMPLNIRGKIIRPMGYPKQANQMNKQIRSGRATLLVFGILVHTDAQFIPIHIYSLAYSQGKRYQRF